MATSNSYTREAAKRKAVAAQRRRNADRLYKVLASTEALILATADACRGPRAGDTDVRVILAPSQLRHLADAARSIRRARDERGR